MSGDVQAFESAIGLGKGIVELTLGQDQLDSFNSSRV